MAPCGNMGNRCLHIPQLWQDHRARSGHWQQFGAGFHHGPRYQHRPFRSRCGQQQCGPWSPPQPQVAFQISGHHLAQWQWEPETSTQTLAVAGPLTQKWPQASAQVRVSIWPWVAVLATLVEDTKMASGVSLGICTAFGGNQSLGHRCRPWL